MAPGHSYVSKIKGRERELEYKARVVEWLRSRDAALNQNLQAIAGTLGCKVLADTLARSQLAPAATAAMSTLFYVCNLCVPLIFIAHHSLQLHPQFYLLWW